MKTFKEILWGLVALLALVAMGSIIFVSIKANQRIDKKEVSVPEPPPKEIKMLRLEARGFIKPPGLSLSEGVDSFLFYGTMNNCLEPNCAQDLTNQFDVNHWLVQEYPLKTGDGTFSVIQNNVWLPLVQINGVQITSFGLVGEAPNQYPAAYYSIYENENGAIVIANDYLHHERAYELVLRCQIRNKRGEVAPIKLRSSLYYNLPEGKELQFIGFYADLTLYEAYFPMFLENQEARFELLTAGGHLKAAYIDTYAMGYPSRLCSTKVADESLTIKGIDIFSGCVELETKP